MKPKRWQGILVFCMIGVLLLGYGVKAGRQTEETLSYADFWQLAQQGEIASVVIGSGVTWQVTMKDGRQAITPNPRAADGKERLLRLGVDVAERENAMPALAVAALFMVLLLAFFSRGRGRGALGMEKLAAVQPDERVPAVTFSDVAVSGDTLRSMQDLVDYLRSPDQFRRYGARFPRGVLLYGPPGTGKTLLAKALAGEAHTAFFAMSGADFVQVYVGVGASRVRELFRKARKAGGGVIFIDEIDAIGKKRDNGNDEREQTLNALLTEMSGFSGQDGIVVLAATNRIDTLDPALLREGRFDRRIEIGLPDYDERLKILQVHARNKPIDDQAISMEDLARQTALFSGAQLETLLNEAAIRAFRRGGQRIESQDIEGAFCALTVGEERPGRMTEAEKKITAYHEAGHAVVTRMMQPEARLTRLTVIPSSRGAAGYAMSVRPDQLLHTRSQLLAMICAALGGRAAEEMLLGKNDVTTGAASDLKKAREIAAAMAGDFVMGETGDADQDARLIFQTAFALTRQCLSENENALHRLARALMEKETLREEEINRAFEDQ
ncbi:MAG: AAA family ATPase [Clostridia bacterium]|nr:AAA family ATPase [Clostridia bacterium]